ncbi:MAG: hypothetical protein ABI824_12785, partial [Acidobacteriota bacterium]
VTVQYELIDSTLWDQYDQGPDVRDDGYYDYRSIMHYPNFGDAIDSAHAEMETVPIGIPIGFRTTLSASDIDASNRLYGFVPTATTITTLPQGFTIVVDGTSYTSPKSFDWAAGSTHTISVTSTQLISSQRRAAFVRWTDGGDQSHTYTATVNRTVVGAEFQSQSQVNVAIGVGSGTGTVAVYPASADRYYPEGTPLRVTATPINGATFAGWTSTGSGIDVLALDKRGTALETLFLELRDALSLRATFSDTPLSIVTSNPPGLSVLIDGIPYITPARFQWIAGSTHTFDLTTPQFNSSQSGRYLFTDWEDGSTSRGRVITVGADTPTYTANFQTQYYLEFRTQGGGSIAGDSITGGSQYVNAGTLVRLTAVPSNGRTLQYWLGATTGDSSLTKTVLMDQPRTARAIFGSTLPAHPAQAATYSSNPIFDSAGVYVSPLEIVALFGPNTGANLGPATAVVGQILNGSYGTQLGNTRILFDDVPAPLLYVSAVQTNVVIPASVAGKSSVTMKVERSGLVVASQLVSVTPTLPGLFTSNVSGVGVVAAFNEDNSVNALNRPAAPGSIVTLFGTGAGLMDRALTDGQILDSNLARPVAPVYVRIGKLPAEVTYAGTAPFLVNGAFQINVRVPEGLSAGEQSVQLIVGNVASPPGATLVVQ